MDAQPRPGAYDRLLTEGLAAALAGVHAEHRLLDPAESPTVLARQLVRSLTHALQETPHGDRVRLVN